MVEELQKSQFSLVLSGGGALGIAHIGVVEDLELYNLSPSEIIGTSMGGIIGACVAIGLEAKEILDVAKEFASVTKWIKFSFSGNSIIESSKIEKIFEHIFGNRMMLDVETPLKIIATDLLTGVKRVFSGSDNILIKDALLATMAIPGIFSEKVIDGRVYADDFLM